MSPQITQVTQNQRDPETYAIIGAAMEVHKRLGCGFLERVYQEALAVEFGSAGIPFQREVEFAIEYRGRILDCKYRADFLCYGRVLVELKAVHVTGGADDAQVINYLKAGPVPVGLLLNFGATSLQFTRFAGPKSVEPV